MVEDEFGLVIVITILVVFVLGIRSYLKYRRKIFQRELEERMAMAHQPPRIYNISERIDVEEGYNRHMSVHEITAHEVDKYNEPPPSYDDVMKVLTVTTSTNNPVTRASDASSSKSI